MSEQKYRPATKEEIESGKPFIYNGPFITLVKHQLAYDKLRSLLTDQNTPELAWLVDRFDDKFPDSDKYAQERRLKPREIPSNFWTNGFRLFNHKYGFLGVLFPECLVALDNKEVAGV